MSLSEDLQSKKSDPDTSSIEKGEQNDIITLAKQRALDISLALPGVAGVHNDNEIDPVDSLRVKRKLDRHILPILCLLYTCMSCDPFSFLFFSFLFFSFSLLFWY